MSTQPVFDHPELVAKTVPEAVWTIFDTQTNNAQTLIMLFYKSNDSQSRRVLIIDKTYNFTEEKFFVGLTSRVSAMITYRENLINEEFFSETTRKLCYSKRTSRATCTTCEEWYDEESGRTVAVRRTKNGLCNGSPAVIIWRPNGVCREETWKEGILHQVRVSNEASKELVLQTWVDGKCTAQNVDLSQRTEIHERDLALPLESEVFKITSADEARKKFVSEEDSIQRALERFEVRLHEALIRRNREVMLAVDEKICWNVVELLKKAGYTVSPSPYGGNMLISF